jgi:hypothetical protein
MSMPGAESQIAFLRQIQRIFIEGEFAATYKYALLLALGELAVGPAAGFRVEQSYSAGTDRELLGLNGHTATALTRSAI